MTDKPPVTRSFAPVFELLETLLTHMRAEDISTACIDGVLVDKDFDVPTLKISVGVQFERVDPMLSPDEVLAVPEELDDSDDP